MSTGELAVTRTVTGPAGRGALAPLGRVCTSAILPAGGRRRQPAVTGVGSGIAATTGRRATASSANPAA
jgi:hypothetical protein